MTETFEKLWDRKVSTELALDRAFASGDRYAIDKATQPALDAAKAYEQWTGDDDTDDTPATVKAPKATKAAPAAGTTPASGIDHEIDSLLAQIQAITQQPGRDGGLDDQGRVEEMQRKLTLLVARRADQKLAAPFVGISDVDLEGSIEKAGLAYEKAVEERDSYSQRLSEGKHVPREGAARRLAQAEAVVTDLREKMVNAKSEQRRRTDDAAWKKARGELKDTRVKREATEVLDRYYKAEIEKAKAVAARDPGEAWWIGKLESEWRQRQEQIPEKLRARVEADVEKQLSERYLDRG